MHQRKVNSVAIIGAGAAGLTTLMQRDMAVADAIHAGAAAASAFAAEDVFETIRVFERRETPGGTW